MLVIDVTRSYHGHTLKEVKVSNDQVFAQSERNFHYKTKVVKTKLIIRYQHKENI